MMAINNVTSVGMNKSQLQLVLVKNDPANENSINKQQIAPTRIADGGKQAAAADRYQEFKAVNPYNHAYNNKILNRPNPDKLEIHSRNSAWENPVAAVNIPLQLQPEPDKLYTITWANNSLNYFKNDKAADSAFFNPKPLVLTDKDPSQQSLTQTAMIQEFSLPVYSRDIITQIQPDNTAKIQNQAYTESGLPGNDFDNAAVREQEMAQSKADIKKNIPNMLINRAVQAYNQAKNQVLTPLTIIGLDLQY